MKHILLSLLIATSLLSARENPFFPAEGMKDLPISSNLASKRPRLKRAAITLPDNARILKKVTITYQNLDGSLKSQSIALDHTVDWHIPIFVSQSYGTTSRKQTPPAASSGTAFHPITPFVRYRLHANTVELQSNDKIIRDFILVNPHRIVIDFKRNSHEKSRTLSLQQAPFSGIKYGNHGTYYRVVIVLDGTYHCDIVKQQGGVRITLR